MLQVRQNQGPESDVIFDFLTAILISFPKKKAYLGALSLIFSAEHDTDIHESPAPKIQLLTSRESSTPLQTGPYLVHQDLSRQTSY